MRPYSCYPEARSRFVPATGRFSNPYFPTFRHVDSGNHLMKTYPAANILRKEDGFDIQMAIPGLAKDQVKIEVEENRLTVSAIPAEATETPKMIRKEFGYQDFKRSFRLHKNANVSAVSASFDQGVLTIHVPDLEKTTTKINIQ